VTRTCVGCRGTNARWKISRGHGSTVYSSNTPSLSSPTDKISATMIVWRIRWQIQSTTVHLHAAILSIF